MVPSLCRAQAVQLTEEKATSCLLLTTSPTPEKSRKRSLMMEGQWGPLTKLTSSFLP